MYKIISESMKFGQNQLPAVLTILLVVFLDFAEGFPMGGLSSSPDVPYAFAGIKSPQDQEAPNDGRLSYDFENNQMRSRKNAKVNPVLSVLVGYVPPPDDDVVFPKVKDLEMSFEV